MMTCANNITTKIPTNKNAGRKWKDKLTKKGTKTNFTSKSSIKKIGDEPIVVHNIRGYNTRKSARFKGIVPDNGNKIVSVLRRDSKSGTIKLNLKEEEEDENKE